MHVIISEFRDISQDVCLLKFVTACQLLTHVMFCYLFYDISKFEFRNINNLRLLYMYGVFAVIVYVAGHLFCHHMCGKKTLKTICTKTQHRYICCMCQSQLIWIHVQFLLKLISDICSESVDMQLVHIRIHKITIHHQMYTLPIFAIHGNFTESEKVPIYA